MSPSNPYFQFYNNTAEQNLFEDIAVESIRNHAHDVFYLPRTGVNKDNLLNEFEIAKFEEALPIEVYVKNFDAFEGEGQLMSKFGFEARDQMTLVMSIRSYNQFVKPITAKTRPHEGDCIFIPMLNVAYQIKFVNESAVFYGMGKLYTWEITCELLEYTNEQFVTGNPVIDDRYPPFENTSSNTYSLENYDDNADNTSIQGESDDVLDFTELDPFEVGEH